MRNGSSGPLSELDVSRYVQGSLSFFTRTSPAKMVVISPCIKAQGTLEPASGHRSPLGQYTSPVAPCCLMLSHEQGKQNLWEGTDGHWTKCVSSSRSWHRVQHNGTEESGAFWPSALPAPGGADRPAEPSAWGGLLGEAEEGDAADCAWLLSLSEPTLTVLSVAWMSAAMGVRLLCAGAASGDELRAWGDTVERGAAEKPGREDKGIFRASNGEGSHGWPSLPFILGALHSPSGSGEAFLFPGRVSFPRSVKEDWKERWVIPTCGNKS